MKKAILVLVATVLLAAPAMADPMPPVDFHYPTLSDAEYTAVATVDLDWNRVWHGGRFTVNLDNGLLPDVAPFETFCVESEITFSPDAVYYASIDEYAIKGRPSASKEKLTPEAAWIDSQFRAGAWDGLYSDEVISRAIWFQQDPLMSGAQNNDVSVLAEDHKDDGIGNVRVLNLWTLQPAGSEWVATDVQSQLIKVPAPAAVLLGVVGLALVGWARKRIR